MTRGPIPRFDLYEELEVSRLASAEVIEAAYRTLVKRHHPDVAADDEAGQAPDADRIKRLNVAKSWLTDPRRRARYDEATADVARAKSQVPAPGPSRRQQVADGAADTAESGPLGFGPNSADVRQLLADLRPLNVARARQVMSAKATMPTTPYAEARSYALRASRGGRHDQWLLARDAATVIALGKLGEWAGAKEVAAIVADAVGAVVVRDLIPLTDYQLLLRPWTWRPDAVIPAVPAPGGVRAVGLEDLRIAAIAAGAAVRARRPMALGVAASALVAVVAFGAMLSAAPKPREAVAALTDAPGSLTAAASSRDPQGSGAAVPGGTSGPSVPGSPLASDALVEPTTGAGATQPTTPRVTLRPTATLPSSSSLPPPSAPTATTLPSPSTAPTAVPTPIATPVPTPVPPPSPSPQVICTVVNLVGVNSSNAQLTWNTAGFTGTVLFNPTIPPQYKIGWQSLAVGTDVLCTSGITVQLAPP